MGSKANIRTDDSQKSLSLELYNEKIDMSVIVENIVNKKTGDKDVTLTIKANKLKTGSLAIDIWFKFDIRLIRSRYPI